MAVVLRGGGVEVGRGVVVVSQWLTGGGAGDNDEEGLWCGVSSGLAGGAQRRCHGW